ncbi:MAG: hypothetical protein K6G45_00800 [Lachnospiraceae bacterium]|nr:hypothetical protein [Lachnospiraceae bacterium]
MIESFENAFQLIVAGGCLIYSAIKAISNRSRVRILLLFFYAEIFLGNLYWQLYLVFFNMSPIYSFVSGFCWSVSFAFMLLLIKNYSKRRISVKKDPLLLVIPVFTAAMAVMFMQWGDYTENIVTAVIMAALILRCVVGLKTVAGKGAYAPAGKTGIYEADRSPRFLYRACLWFCTANYLSWISSTFFFENSITNPYYWFDTVITISLVFFIPALNRCDKNIKEQVI